MTERRLRRLGDFTTLINVACLVLVLGVLYCAARQTWVPKLGMSTVSVFLLLYLATAALNIVWGYGGYFSIAYAPIGGIGAYGAAIALREGWSLYAAVGVGLVAAVLAAVFVYVGLRRLRGIQYAIATFGVGLLISQITNTLHFTGGAQGIVLADSYRGVPTSVLEDSERFDLIVIAAVCVLVAWAIANGFSSVLGREVISLRENANYASSLGLRTIRIAALTAALAGLVAGLGGVLYTMHIKAIDPTSFSVGTLGFNAIMALLIGGRGTFWGPFVGAALLTAATTFQPWQGYVTYVLIGAVAILVARVFPRGVAGGVAELMRQWRHRRSAIPLGAGAVSVPLAHPGIGANLGSSARSATFTARGIHFSYRQEVIVDNVDLVSCLDPPGIVGIAGPNGAGKSTFMSVLSGALRPSAGAVEIDGRPLPANETARVCAGITRVPQDTPLLPEATVLDCVLIGLASSAQLMVARSIFRTRRVRARERSLRVRARRLLEDFNLERYTDFRVSELSYGNRRLVAIAVATATAPRVLLLDEPTAGLSPAAITNVSHQLRQLAATGMNIVVIDHRLDFLDALTKRIVMMANGQILAEGSLSDHLQHAEVVEAYIGDVAGGRKPAATDKVPRTPAPAISVTPAQPHPADRGVDRLSLSGVSVGYGGKSVLTEVSMDVLPRSVAGWVGPNGAGKTTLGAAVAGLIPLSSGRLQLGVSDITDATILGRVRLGIAFVPAGRRVFPYMTVRDNLAVAAHTAGKGADSVDRAFELFPALRRHARRSAGQMSGGEMQMLVTARGMVGEPKYLVLDEPFAGLSPKVCEQLQAVLLDSVERTGAALILIDQDVSRLASFADSLSMLASGRLQISAPTRDVVSRTDLFETFLGVAGSAVLDVESIASAADELEEISGA